MKGNQTKNRAPLLTNPSSQYGFSPSALIRNNEVYVSSQEFQLKIHRITNHNIIGNLILDFDRQAVIIPFEGMANNNNNKQIDFCFIIEWDSYIDVGNGFTTFSGKKYLNNNIEYIDLMWHFTPAHVEHQFELMPTNGTVTFVKKGGLRDSAWFLNKPTPLDNTPLWFEEKHYVLV